MQTFASNPSIRSSLSGYDTMLAANAYGINTVADPFDNDEETTTLYLALMLEDSRPVLVEQDLAATVSVCWNEGSSASSCSSNSTTTTTVPTAAPDTDIDTATPSWSESSNSNSSVHVHVRVPPCIVLPAQQNTNTITITKTLIPQVNVPVTGPPFTEPQPGFVSVYLLVDPVMQKVTMLPQTLRYENQTCEVGEIELHTFPKEAIESFTKQVVVKQQEHNAEFPEVQVYSTILPQQTPARPYTPILPAAPLSTFPEQNTSSLFSDTSVESTLLGAKIPDASISRPAPLRALSAYNYFFRDERERLLQSQEQADNNDIAARDLSSVKQEKLLSDHWNRSRTAKRPHRKTHGKISFAELSRRISASWKRLGSDAKAFYKEIAAKDWNRYQWELHEHKMLEETTNAGSPAVVR